MSWHALDTWTTVTAVSAALACTLPGLWLVLRRHSMMGDAIAHSALLGIVSAFLLVAGLEAAGVVSEAQHALVYDGALFLGATIVGVFTAFLTEWVQKIGRLDPGAALGVVFSSLFALGLLLVRMAADRAHIDLDCVLFGDITSAVWDTVPGTELPRAAAVNFVAFALNGVLTVACFKELRISSFDADHAAALGIKPRVVHYLLLTMTAITVVAAFRTVGSILVIALLVVPAATSLLLSRSLKVATLLALGIAIAGGVLGHIAARTLPGLLFGDNGALIAWGITDVSTAGMVSVVCGLLFTLAWLLSPRGGLLPAWWRQLSTTIDVAAEDLLGGLWRLEERGLHPNQASVLEVVGRRFGAGRWLMRLARNRLRDRGYLHLEDGRWNRDGAWHLTDPGRKAARKLIRAHRLWEAYLAKHFTVPADHLHHSAMRVEHNIDPALARQLEAELDAPDEDPHGRVIPPRENG